LNRIFARIPLEITGTSLALPEEGPPCPALEGSGVEMKRAKLALELLFQRQGEIEDSGADRMAREIRGSVFVLIGLFFLVSLTSYLPLDTVNIFQGRIDQVNNFAGIVGALIAEWVLGSVGAPGYSLLFIVAWLAFCAFKNLPLKNQSVRILGVLIATLLSAVAAHLIFASDFPEVSLWQGGWMGRKLGDSLQQYFNMGGALLLVMGGYVFTAILTAGLSFTGVAKQVWDSEEEEEEEFLEEAPSLETGSASQVATETVSPAPASIVVPIKRAKRKVPVAAETPVEETPAEAPSVYQFTQMIPAVGAYQLPSLRLMKGAENKVKRLSKAELRANGEMIVGHLASFQITGEVTAITEGPVITTYEFKPAAGIKLSKIANLQDDLGVVLGTNQLRVIAPIPGKTVVGIEVPRPQSETIALKDILGEDAFYDKKLQLPVALGKSTDGRPLFGDLAAMPHLLVAGSTGSGKSVFMNSLIMSLLYRLTPQQLRLILIDPKMLEFAAFAGLPHLVADVITDNKIAINAMSWACTEMDRRYALMAKTSSKNIESYNSKMRSAEDKLPLLVVVVDELADLMMSGGELVEISITRLAQKARAAGIHLVIATQRPSAEVITGLIKANIPSRISFKVPSSIDSRTILDTSGAEELIGRGDSLMLQPAVPLRRIHGTFVTEEELARVVKFVKGGKSHAKNYISFAGSRDDE
jgi:DNA segregation ATPase FtsK/SpoIIIE, S-DNA-T family